MRQIHLSIATCFLALIALSQKATAQFTVAQQTANFLVQNVLVGQGVQVSNITFTGDPSQIGQFQGGNLTNLGINSGVVMTTGDVTTNVVGPNDQGGYTSSPALSISDDPDLNSIISSLGAGAVTNNVCVIEFDFIPSGDSLRFNYIFGSEEYDEYVCSSFFDAFGFFLSGPGIAGPFSNNAINLALVPGTNLPVGINTVNNGTAGMFGDATVCPNGGLNNSQYYETNPDSLSLQMDGFTSLLTAEAELQCGNTYHIKLVIANGGDTSFDSWVFLQAESFSSNIPKFQTTNLLPDSSVVEACVFGGLLFTRDQADLSLTIPITYGGTAINGVDYTGLPDTLFFPAGQDTLVINMQPVNDGITEGIETVIITFSVPNECGDTILVTQEFKIRDPYELSINTPDPVLNCPNNNYTVGLQVTGGYPPYSYTWDYNSLQTPTINVPIIRTDTFTVQIHDVLNCFLNQYTDTVIVTLNYDSLQTTTQDTLICLNSPVTISPSVTLGNQPYTYNWVGQATTQDITVMPLDTTTYVIEITDQCNITATDSFIVYVPLYDSLIVSAWDTTICERGVATLQATVTGGNGYYTYTWLGAGPMIPVNDSISTVTPTEPISYICVVSDGCNIVANDTLQIDIMSCLLKVPNAYSPNGDGINDFFEVANILFYPDNTVYLFNRWGKKVLEQKSYQNNWSGGDDVTSGTYFYIVDPGDGTEILKGTVTVFKN